MTVAVLFARAGSVYLTMPGLDVYTEARDARRWRGGSCVIAHPMCRGWGRLRQFSHATEEERQHAVTAVWMIRASGGVLEHPEASGLWEYLGLPLPGRGPDYFGGYTIEIRQCDWGHPAEKLTWLYVVGCHVDDLPTIPPPRRSNGRYQAAARRTTHAEDRHEALARLDPAGARPLARRPGAAVRGEGNRMTKITAPRLAWAECMRRDIAVLVTCHAVQLLPNWQYSRGACLEEHVARELGLEILQPVLRRVWAEDAA